MSSMLSTRILYSVYLVALAAACTSGSRNLMQAGQQPPATQVAKPSNAASTLRTIPAFQVKLTVDFKAPKAQDIIERLRIATKTDLTLADDINQKYPALGSLSCRNVPAWVIMEDLAKSKRIEGCWEKDGNGYRLVRNGNPVLLAEEAKERAEQEKAAQSSALLVSLIAGAALLVALSLAYWWVRRRANRTPAAAVK